MKCVVLKSPRDMVVENRSLSTDPGPGYVPIDVRAVGICGSDLHAYQGTQPFQTYPRILGHEIAGVVCRQSDSFNDGQPVVVEPLLRCGLCYACRVGRYNCCRDLKVLGVHADGGMCETIWAREESIFSLPQDVSIDEGALTEPLAIACQVTTRARVAEGDTVLIIGAGPIGLLSMQVAKARDAEVYVSDVDPQRLRLAERLGADDAINPTEEVLEDRLDELTIGEGPNVVIEAVGSKATIRQAIDLVSAAGRVVIVGLYGGSLQFEPLTLVRKELDVMGSRNSADMFPVAISLISEGKVKLSELVTDRFRLEMAPNVFRSIDEGEIRPVKALLLSPAR